jgi:acyl carrier protein
VLAKEMADMNSEIESLVREVLNLDSKTAIESLEASNCPAWDSLRHVEIILKLQTKFGIKLSSSEMVGMRSVAQIKQTVIGRANQK